MRRPEASTMETWGGGNTASRSAHLLRLLSPPLISVFVQSGTYSSYGHEDVHCPRSHGDILDVIWPHPGRGIYAVGVVVDLEKGDRGGAWV